MPKSSFTVRWIDSVNLPEKGQVDYFDERTSGLGLRVSVAGRKSWFVMYRHVGRLRRYTLGTYPALGLSDARDKARELLYEAAIGNDPATEKQVNRGAPTLLVKWRLSTLSSMPKPTNAHGKKINAYWITIYYQSGKMLKPMK